MAIIKNPLTLIKGGTGTLIEKSITENGTYNAQDDNADGYSEVTVNVSGGGGDIDGLIDGTLTSITSNATSIRRYCLYNFTGLQSVNFPLAIIIDNYAFGNCSSLTSASFPKATSIGNYAFQSSGLQSASFPLVTSIGTYAFNNCSSLTSVSFPLVTSIGTYAFQSSGLQSVNFPLLTSINTRTFTLCQSLTNASFPLVTSIGNYAFDSCGLLTSITLGANQVCTLSNANAMPSQNITVYVPSDLITSYQTATNWSSLYNNGRVTFVAIAN